MTADIESFTTYFAVCEDCEWEGPHHEDDKSAAEADASKHECPGQDRDSFQASLDAAMKGI